MQIEISKRYTMMINLEYLLRHLSRFLLIALVVFSYFSFLVQIVGCILIAINIGHGFIISALSVAEIEIVELDVENDETIDKQ